MRISYEVYPIKVHHNFTYLIVDKVTRQAALVDPAWEFGTITTLINQLKVDVQIILLTHSHIDHVQLVHPLAERYQTHVYMSLKEIETYQFTCPSLHPFTDLDILHLGQTRITCLLTPGHTAGSACFLLADSLFTGDTLFIEGCGICPTASDAHTMYDSFQKIKSVAPPHVKVYPGHQYRTSPGCPLHVLFRNNIYFQLSREYFVKFRMRKNQQGLFNFQ
ncbi:MBL fold metallo-hydrolase [Marininema halotolerans]|uniref:Glyoxylase, beta-lactamase superfamily II n=1 Tax=Marininema halotolerans TaxID=1155944 RepID=A0A1I6PQX1_9BACL|nr:MBL fold metallo-hydrolase [Marininema halotolerans]SFS42623.1 Glyoxylase, beta-lactamase superfamily II [Marininema halotolerans]